MLKSVLAYLAIFSSTVLSESLRSSASSSDQRELTSTCGSGVCYLYDIQKGSRIKVLKDNYGKRYQVAPIEHYHKGYSIECDFDKEKVDYLIWYFPDGKKNYRVESRDPYWLNGDDNGNPFYVEWLGQSGYKYIKLEAYDKNKNVCFRKTFELEAYCPSGYYDWYGHCYKWAF